MNFPGLNTTIANISKTEYLIAGLEVSVFGLEELKKVDEPNEVAAVFVLHGRTGCAAQLDFLSSRVVAESQTTTGHSRIITISFDQRNHGTRLKDSIKNLGWSEEQGNVQHELDMWSIQYGTSRDVLYLIDILPMYLGLDISKWGICGVSLGGHATLISMELEPRISVGVSLIGCGDYGQLISERGKNSGLEINRTTHPLLFRCLDLYDPVNHVERFQKRPLLMLGGEEDDLVPMKYSNVFVDKLRKSYADTDRFSVKMFPQVGHWINDEMLSETIQWLQHWL
ncbi:hypothetical protein K7432_014050 [Basidiobolus ranarum]|uniref:Peptidase S9 prolyl oligopeptidase catalytic domain-containing protein n=1 Tax=Basidiobolus ranarum TaxID=34480 RepID=A0ABR2WI71_9FUNG